MSRSTLSLLKLAERLIPVLAAVGGAVWALFVHFDHQNDIARQGRGSTSTILPSGLSVAALRARKATLTAQGMK
jgi:hypothetical protein